MCTILLSIKPKYVDEILNESKKYEYRKRIAKKPVERILIYATHPMKEIVGEVQVTEVLCDSPEVIWKQTREFSGIDEKAFFEYFDGNAIAYAYELGELNVFEKALSLSSFGVTAAPQSFCYISGGGTLGEN